MKEKRKFSGEFISEMESLNILGGTAEPLDDVTNTNCEGGNCANCANCSFCYCLPTNGTLFCPGPCGIVNSQLGCFK